MVILISRRDKDVYGDVEKVEELDCMEIENVPRRYNVNSLEYFQISNHFPCFYLKQKYYSNMKSDKLDMIVAVNFTSILCLRLLLTLILS